MRIAYFTHSIVSDWNHGNAHFLRGLLDALARRGHEVHCWEPAGGWALTHLVEHAGPEPIVRFAREFPALDVHAYRLDDTLPERLAAAVRDADVVLVHEWSDARVVGLLATLRARSDGFALLFHDTHHRPVSDPATIASLNLGCYDGVLAFGASLRRVYLERYGVRRAWTFHEAADTRRFRPLEREKSDDVVWIGNWGDEERSDELRRYWLASARALPELRWAAYGARYPDHVRKEVACAGVELRGWAPSLEVPELLARARLTLHIPRRLYVDELPGIPTIRVFEALACGVPLISTPWDDVEELFDRGDFAIAREPREMTMLIRRLIDDADARARLAERGLRAVRARHTCEHRADQLETIIGEVGRAGA